MTDGPTHQDFAKCVNQKCRVFYESGSVEMELTECRKAGVLGRKDGPREPFALLFRGPKTPVLPQRIYRFDFEQLGAIEIFIVPIGRDESGMSYEAIFT